MEITKKNQMLNKSLINRKQELANPQNQLQILDSGIFENGRLPKFKEKLNNSGDFPIVPGPLKILQINLGYMCNQVCSHCHVDAGPDRREIMSKEVMLECLQVMEEEEIDTVDLTGGAPEMNPEFRWFVEEISRRGVREIIVRSNLTILRANKKYYDLPQFFKNNKVHVISSLPYFKKEKTDRQRGKGVFNKSIEALTQLNEVGYGKEGTGLELDLVYNPSGAFMPGDQNELQSIFKQKLKENFNVYFNQLFTITNLPISRFLEFLLASDNYEEYMESLVAAYNPAALPGLMCRNTLSVDWTGKLYDCDFNQMLGLEINASSARIGNYHKAIQNREVRVSQHCYGCTAGAGSSCQGSLA